MENKEFAKQLEERTLMFGVRIIQLSVKLPKTDEARVVRTQITKSGTSIGANAWRQTDPEVKLISKTKLKFVRANLAKQFIG